MDTKKLTNLLPENIVSRPHFISTRDSEDKIHCEWNDALKMGLSSDLGLFLPSTIPVFGEKAIDALKDLSYPETAWIIMRNFLPQDDVPDDILADICYGAYSATEIPLEEALDDNGLVIARLDRGPSCSFKDFAARFLARLMSYYLTKSGQHATILVATSGDTGTAIQTAFYDLPNTHVLVLYPAHRVSEVQEKQMLSIHGNVRAIPIDGNFDDCQRLAKTLLSRDDVRAEFNLTSANSISLWRLLPQTIYYFYIWAELNKRYPDKEILFSVPSGNLGNLTAGLLAKRMGLPVKMFIAGTNANNMFANIVGKGSSLGSLSNRYTLANSMDISIPSNLERILFLYGENPENIPDILLEKKSISPEVAEALRQDVFSEDIISNEDMESHIFRFWRRNNIVLEPHGVIGVAASFRYRQYYSEKSIICVLETASPSKFPEFQHHYPEIPIPQCGSLAELADMDLDAVRPAMVAADPEAVIQQLKELTQTS